MNVPVNLFIAVPAAVGAVAVIWYAYQVASRKQTRVRYKLKRVAIGMPVYLVATVYLRNGHGFTDWEVVIMSALMSMGAVWLFVNPPKQSRYVPKSVRRAVIKRDLGIEAEEMDSSKYHVDHEVPYSRGGDNSVRNPELKQKQKILRRAIKCLACGSSSERAKLPQQHTSIPPPLPTYIRSSTAKVIRAPCFRTGLGSRGLRKWRGASQPCY